MNPYPKAALTPIRADIIIADKPIMRIFDNKDGTYDVEYQDFFYAASDPIELAAIVSELAFKVRGEL